MEGLEFLRAGWWTYKMSLNMLLKTRFIFPSFCPVVICSQNLNFFHSWETPFKSIQNLSNSQGSKKNISRNLQFFPISFTSQGSIWIWVFQKQHEKERWWFPMNGLRKTLAFGQNQGWAKTSRGLKGRQWNLQDYWWQRVIGRKNLAWASVHSGSVTLSKLLNLSGPVSSSVKWL